MVEPTAHSEELEAHDSHAMLEVSDDDMKSSILVEGVGLWWK